MDRGARIRLSHLWAALEEAVMAGGLSEILGEPWESQSPAVRAAWDTLTRPENLPDLESWLADDRGGRGMTKYAETATRKAIEVCRARGAVG